MWGLIKRLVTIRLAHRPYASGDDRLAAQWQEGENSAYGNSYDQCVCTLDRVEAGRRRRWSADEKIRIVLESMANSQVISDNSSSVQHLALAAH
jgi:hypothetical protein